MKIELYKICLLLVVAFCFSMQVMAQSKEGIVINVENNEVYLDLTKAQVKNGDQIEVIVEGGYMTHPKTGAKIKKQDETVARLTIKNAYDEYSVASSDAQTLQKLKSGMRVKVASLSEGSAQTETPSSTQPTSSSSLSSWMPSNLTSLTSQTIQSELKLSDDRIPIVIAPAEVNDVVNNGHFGGYVADILMEQMLLCNKVRLLDRSVLNAQMDEIELAGSLLDPNTTIKRGMGIGARYILQTTMQKPDVANIRTGIPLASIMGAVQGATSTNIGAQYASNMSVAKLKAQVNITVRVVDLQTGEVMFMCSGKGQATGESQVAFEYGALSGGEVNGGAQGFKQTVTGKAIQKAFNQIGRNLTAFFNGETDRKVMGSASGSGINQSGNLIAKGYKLYLGTEKLNKDDISLVFSEHPDLYFQYKKAKRKRGTGIWVAIGGTALCVFFGQALCEEANTALGQSIAFGGTAASVIGGICIANSGKKQVKNIVNTYNSYNSRYHSSSGVSLSVTGNGLCLTF